MHDIVLVYQIQAGKVLDLFHKRIKDICAFPIRFSQLEAAPVAMVAITDHI